MPILETRSEVKVSDRKMEWDNQPFQDAFTHKMVCETPQSKVASTLQRGSCVVWEIKMEVCLRLDFENIMLFNCLGYNFNIYGAFEFLCNSIANLRHHE